MTNQIQLKVLYVVCLILCMSLTKNCDARILKQENSESNEKILDFSQFPSSNNLFGGFPFPDFPIPGFPNPPSSESGPPNVPSFPFPGIPDIPLPNIPGFPFPFPPFVPGEPVEGPVEAPSPSAVLGSDES
ncbi:PREDICTED: U1 small nuclear ribonucleoprotein C-like [Ipomoea nil]|uniref:U1 small nuclear ribonucleoprotein C-like n=1 Tax=Ipomoea nil TaxID=35883 RepID=UPI000900EDF1|nr:PREDICTED: U1 small nuclear ribonucleoprotein C-like [Ipomoea nil]